MPVCSFPPLTHWGKSDGSICLYTHIAVLHQVSCSSFSLQMPATRQELHIKEFVSLLRWESSAWASETTPTLCKWLLCRDNRHFWPCLLLSLYSFSSWALNPDPSFFLVKITSSVLSVFTPRPQSLAHPTIILSVLLTRSLIVDVNYPEQSTTTSSA